MRRKAPCAILGADAPRWGRIGVSAHLWTPQIFWKTPKPASSGEGPLSSFATTTGSSLVLRRAGNVETSFLFTSCRLNVRELRTQKHPAPNQRAMLSWVQISEQRLQARFCQQRQVICHYCALAPQVLQLGCTRTPYSKQRTTKRGNGSSWRSCRT